MFCYNKNCVFQGLSVQSCLVCRLFTLWVFLLFVFSYFVSFLTVCVFLLCRLVFDGCGHTYRNLNFKKKQRRKCVNERQILEWHQLNNWNKLSLQIKNDFEKWWEKMKQMKAVLKMGWNNKHLIKKRQSLCDFSLTSSYLISVLDQCQR